MTGPDLARAGERLRRQIESLGELRNAGARDQRFKVWRQDTLTLLQRMWPGDHVKAERFRRIPFSAPAGRADRGGTREYFERGCKEAEVYLEGLAIELGIHAGAPAVNEPQEAEAPVPGSAWTGPETEAEPAREEEPGLMIPTVPASDAGQVPIGSPSPEAPSPVEETAVEPAAEPALPPPPPRKPITFKPAASPYETLPISFLGPERRKTARPPGSEGPLRRREDVPASYAVPPVARPAAPPVAPPPAPAVAAAAAPPTPDAASSLFASPAPVAMPPETPPAASAAPSPPAATAGDDTAQAKSRPKMRLKDMLGFGDAPLTGVEPVTPHAPAQGGTSAPSPRVEVPMSPDRASTPASEPIEAEPAVNPRMPQRDYAAEFILESPVLQSQAHPLRHRVHGEAEPSAEPAAVSPQPPAPAVPTPEVAMAPEVIPMPVREPEPVSMPDTGMDAEPGLPSQLAAEEIYELATRILEFGVPAAHAAILRAALIDLGRQLENPPVHWGALRETIAFAMDYPELARRLLPRLLPYLSQAA